MGFKTIKTIQYNKWKMVQIGSKKVQKGPNMVQTRPFFYIVFIIFFLVSTICSVSFSAQYGETPLYRLNDTIKCPFFVNKLSVSNLVQYYRRSLFKRSKSWGMFTLTLVILNECRIQGFEKIVAMNRTLTTPVLTIK